MTDDATLVAVLVLAAALVVTPVAAAAPSGGPAATDAAQETETATPTTTPTADGAPAEDDAPATGENASVAPGEQLSGVVGVQGAEIEGEVAERTYGVKVARASTDRARAGVVAGQLDDVEGRVAELERRQERLREARENGSISEGEFRAKMATVAAELETAERLANASGETARGLPADVLNEKGIDVGAVQTLRDRAANLSGPEVAEIARSIAGEDVGRSMAGAQRPSDVADRTPENPGNASDGGAPNGTDRGPQNGSDDAPDGTDAGTQDGGASSGTDGGAPNGTDGGQDQY